MPDLDRTISRMKRVEETIGDPTAYGSGQVLRDAIALLEAYQKASKWIPAAERLPEEDGEYLVVLQFEGNPRMVCEYRTVPGMWMVKATVGWWMPVPENPKEENGDVEEE